ncbi:hypothetical protein Z518_01969 [Neofusicoccum parvum]|nr:hypothetical protein Z518_01969 [Neofusicoccum parvum]
METTPVIIVGAGPAGLALGLALARHEIQSVILEKENGITDDPRGVYLAGDAVRIVWDLGIGEEMPKIGHENDRINFHYSTFLNPAFFHLDMATDCLHQTVPEGILQIQPKLEQALRNQIQASPYCQLRSSCKVVSRQELSDSVIVGYEEGGAGLKHLKGSWLVGADGKRGVVRKQFLEPAANIRQETGLFTYEGTWVAANIKIHLPTPATHPDFPLWRFGFSPQQVYDLFWPTGWHFCCPPGYPTATGRFGPHEDRLWRHEFAIPKGDKSTDSTVLFWDHLLPMVTRDQDQQGKRFPGGAVTFPRDCIEILRCRPFTFCQKVVNKWFDKRTILVGDAAHVFPPFGGQGIACGIRDSYGLAWRLALLLQVPNSFPTVSNQLLSTWASERRQGVDDAAFMTMLNGKIVNETGAVTSFIWRAAMSLLSYIPFVPKPAATQERIEVAGYKPTKDKFGEALCGGGAKMAQIYFESSRTASPRFVLSDSVLKRYRSILTLVVLSSDASAAKQDKDDVSSAIRHADLPQSILAQDSLLFVCPRLSRAASSDEDIEVFYPASEEDLKGQVSVRPLYSESSYFERLGSGTRYAVVRPDFIVFAAARSLGELEGCLRALKCRLSA